MAKFTEKIISKSPKRFWFIDEPPAGSTFIPAVCFDTLEEVSVSEYGKRSSYKVYDSHEGLILEIKNDLDSPGE